MEIGETDAERHSHLPAIGIGESGLHGTDRYLHFTTRAPNPRDAGTCQDEQERDVKQENRQTLVKVLCDDIAGATHRY